MRQGSDPLPIDLALQGGGSHGAFTWGVLDRLLDEPRLAVVAISGTSAGAMNGAVLADGWTERGAEGARAALGKYWEKVSRSARLQSAAALAARPPPGPLDPRHLAGLHHHGCAVHRESYFGIVMTGIVSAVLALVAVIVLGSAFGSF
jgi:predicted acylesterase/phospholipase RssA